MKIAATYQNGEIFQHFGHSEQFKVYNVEDGKIISSEVIGTNGSGHGALANLLESDGIDVLICGGIGGGAINALTACGIELVAGAAGNADELVQAYIDGKLVNDPNAKCSHHDHADGHDCGSHGEGHTCGGNCHQ